MKRIAWIAAVGAAVMFWSFTGDDAPTTQRGTPAKALLDRVWIDHMPKTPRDKFDVFAAVGDPTIGVFQHTSAFEGEFALFEWKRAQDGKLSVVMLQAGKRHTLKFEVSRGNCAPFDQCLTLTGAPRGSKTYGSMDDWVIEGFAGDASALASTARATALSTRK